MAAPEAEPFPDEADQADAADQQEEEPAPKVRKKVAAPRGRFGAGIGVGSPDGVPLELLWFTSARSALRLFASPPVTFSASLYIPPQAVSQGQVSRIVTEAKTVDLRVDYGPSAGVEGMFFPWRGAFFVAGGLSYRRVRLSGNDSARLVICKSSETNCGVNSTGDGVTPSRLYVDAEATSDAVLARAACGWSWSFRGQGYVTLTGIGLAVPVSNSRSVNVDGEIATNLPAWADALLAKAIADVEAQAEKDGEAAVAAEMEPYERLLLPVAGVSVGWRF